MAQGAEAVTSGGGGGGEDDGDGDGRAGTARAEEGVASRARLRVLLAGEDEPAVAIF